MIPASALYKNLESDTKGQNQIQLTMSATTSVFVLTEQPPYLGNIKKDGAAEQIRLFLMSRKQELLDSGVFGVVQSLEGNNRELPEIISVESQYFRLCCQVASQINMTQAFLCVRHYS